MLEVRRARARSERGDEPIEVGVDQGERLPGRPAPSRCRSTSWLVLPQMDEAGRRRVARGDRGSQPLDQRNRQAAGAARLGDERVDVDGAPQAATIAAAAPAGITPSSASASASAASNASMRRRSPGRRRRRPSPRWPACARRSMPSSARRLGISAPRRFVRHRLGARAPTTRTLSTRLPSRSTTSKRQPSHSTESAVRAGGRAAA